MTDLNPRNLLAAMNQEEKIAQLLCVSITDLLTDGQFDRGKAEKQLGGGVGQIARAAGWSHKAPGEALELIREIQDYLREETRLGVPAIFHEETNSGLQVYGATVFPQAIGVACTWNVELVEEMHDAIRKEARSLEVHSALSPVLDLVVDARWGRGEEAFGEDRLLTGRMATAAVKGLQSSDLKDGIGATLKHFAGHGHSEGGRNEAPVHMGERELRDYALVPFEMTIKQARPMGVMNAYHDIDSLPCAANEFLLTDILRDEWGFDGIVVSDYEAVDQVRRMHFLAPDKAGAAALSLSAGIDIELPFPDCFAELDSALDRGLVEEQYLDRAVSRVLKAKDRLGLLDGSRAATPELTTLDSDAHRELSLKVAEQSIVMLKNDSILPLTKDGGKIAVIGPFADETRNMLGDYAFTAAYDLPDGTKGGAGVYSAVKERFANRSVAKSDGSQLNAIDKRLQQAAVKEAQDSDCAIIVVGGRSGSVPLLRGFDEHGDMSGEGRDRASVELVDAQKRLVDAVADTGTPVVLVVVDGRPLALGNVADRVDAILYAWLPGHCGGEAIARIIAGDVSPSGRLCVSLPRETGQTPVQYSRHPASSKWNYVFGSNAALYGFGHGLTYSRFAYRDISLLRNEIGTTETTELTFTVENTGSVRSVAIPQIYFRDLVSSVVRPVKLLLGYDRIALDPGESQVVSLSINAEEFAFHDRTMKRIVEPGDFKLMVGESSEDVQLETVLRVVD